VRRINEFLTIKKSLRRGVESSGGFAKGGDIDLEKILHFPIVLTILYNHLTEG